MICPHCEGTKNINCHCEKPRTISSLDVPDDVRDLADDLTPLPISNERLWAVIDNHLSPKRVRVELQAAMIKHQDRLVQELMRRNEGARRYISDNDPASIETLHRILSGEERYGEVEESAGP